MSNILKWISFGFLGYRVYSLYAKKAAGAMDWNYTINGIGLTKYSTKFIEGFVDWEFINATELVGQVKDINVDLLYKGSKIGSISMPGPYLVPAKGSADVRTNFRLELEQVYAKAIMALSELAQYGDIDLQIKGSARVRSGQLLWAKIPVETTTTAKTLYSYFS
jgi:hypothetical protein